MVDWSTIGLLLKTEIIHFFAVPFLATTVKIYAYLLSMMLKSTLNLTRSNFTFCLNMNQICKLGWNHWYYVLMGKK